MLHNTNSLVITYLSKVEVTHTRICKAGVDDLLKLSRHHFGDPWRKKTKQTLVSLIHASCKAAVIQSHWVTQSQWTFSPQVSSQVGRDGMNSIFEIATRATSARTMRKQQGGAPASAKVELFGGESREGGQRQEEVEEEIMSTCMKGKTVHLLSPGIAHDRSAFQHRSNARAFTLWPAVVITLA